MRVVKEFAGHTATVMSLVFVFDGQELVSGSQDETIRVWDLHQGQLIRTLTGHNALVDTIAVIPDGKYLISAGTETVKIWERQ